MARPLCITFPGAFYHVTLRGNESKSVFKKEMDRRKFPGYLESAAERNIKTSEVETPVTPYCPLSDRCNLFMDWEREKYRTSLNIRLNQYIWSKSILI